MPGHVGPHGPAHVQQRAQLAAPLQIKEQLARLGRLALARQAVKVNAIQVETEIAQIFLPKMLVSRRSRQRTVWAAPRLPLRRRAPAGRDGF
jgi:hypothetical protein